MKRDPVRDLGRWLYYLLPANPIIVRVVHSSGRRTRHLWYRFIYLFVLFLVLMFASFLLKRQSALSDMAKGSTQVFQFIAMTQLLLMSFLAPVFTAAAITQEKDAETYNILLTTPLSNAQIIFGSLLSRLFFVLTLLFSGLPIFAITMVYGGVTLRQIILSFGIAGCTAVITGSLAIMISVMKVGTRRTIFSFFLVIGLYLLLGYVLGRWDATAVSEAPASAVGDRRMSWLAPYHPFLALEVGLSKVPAPTFADVAHHGWPLRNLLSAPHVSYCIMTTMASLVMVAVSMLFVRRGAKEGEVTLGSRLSARLNRAGPAAGEMRRKPRRVWSNPVAWREANTRASAASAGFMRWFLIGGGALAAITVLYCLVTGQTVWSGGGTFGPAEARAALRALITVEFGLILLVVLNASATSMTKEDEANTMDILMTTPLTSQAVIWGKLRGLVSFALPVLAVPVGSMALFAVYGLFSAGESVATLESVLELAVMTLIYTAVACLIGLQTSLRSKKTMQAVVVSVMIMSGVYGLSYLIGDAIVSSAGDVGAALAPFTPFTAVKMMTDPRSYGLPVLAASTRVTLLVGTVLAAAAWGGIVGFGTYKALVKNFHMTIRRKTAS